MWVKDAYERREAAIYWNSGPYKGPKSVGIRYAHTKHLNQTTKSCFKILSLRMANLNKSIECTWYVNTPWCDVLINKVFSTFPTTLARNTTSNEVLPPGGIICKKKKDKNTKLAKAMCYRYTKPQNINPKVNYSRFCKSSWLTRQKPLARADWSWFMQVSGTGGMGLIYNRLECEHTR